MARKADDKGVTLQRTERVHTKDGAALRLVGALSDYIPQVMAVQRTPGLNIALAYHGKLVWEAGFGLADLASGTPMTPDTVYRSGSLGKTYTATAIMILVDRDIIALDDPIDRHLPFKVANPLGKREIMVRDLMLHRSGLGGDAALPRYAPGAPLAQTLEAEFAKDVSPIARGMTPRWASEVGAAWCYSNLGLATLGLIVETANPEKLDFSTFVQRRIMDPLGMTHSQYPRAQHADFARPDLWALASTGYARMGVANIPTIPLVFAEFPAGGVLARPADHIRLLLAMLGKGELDGYRLFAPETAAQMLTPAGAIPGLDDVDQGLIWRLNAHGKPHASFDHSGGHMFGWRTQGRAWVNSNAAVMVASNQWSVPEDSRDVDQITSFIGSWLAFEPRAAMAEGTAPSASALSYARGAFLAASYYAFCGIEGAPSASVVDAMIAGARVCQGSPDDWDAEAFRRGFAAIYQTDGTVEGVKRFWGSPVCEIDVATVRRAYQALGGPDPGLISLVLPSAAGH